METASQYCTALEQLDPARAVNAVHAALMQLNAFESGLDNLDNREAIAQLRECLRSVGHAGFSGTTQDTHEKGIKGINVRFFCYSHDDEMGTDIEEITEAEFLRLGGEISYERNSVFENGCRQICLTTDSFKEN